MMPLFDQFSQAQAGNGQNVQPPQPTMGVPGFNPQSWGNQPGNFAGGMQNFLQQRMGQSGQQMIPPNNGGLVPPGGPPVMGAPNMMQTPPSQPGIVPAAAGGGRPNFAGGMQPYLGRGLMR